MGILTEPERLYGITHRRTQLIFPKYMNVSLCSESVDSRKVCYPVETNEDRWNVKLPYLPDTSMA